MLCRDEDPQPNLPPQRRPPLSFGDRVTHQIELEARCRRTAGGPPGFADGVLGGSLIERFRRRVAADPCSLASATIAGSVTYRELADQAWALAAALAGARGDRVGILAGHELALPVALLGVLAGGCAAVPLDPLYPADRLRSIAAGEALTAVVAGADVAGLARQLVPGVRVIDPGSLAPVPMPTTFQGGPDIDDAAVVLYTSGSTGRPKRVVHTHRSILHEIQAYTQKVGLGPQDRLLLVSSPSFADSLRTVWGALANGAALCPFDLRRGGFAGLHRFLDDQRITIYRSVPSVLRELAGALPTAAPLAAVRIVYLAGEPVVVADVAAFRRLFPRDAVLVNGLGTCETLTFAWFLVGHDTPLEGDAVPVGWPVPGRTVRLVGPDGGPVFAAEVGEVEVRTPSLAPSVGASDVPPRDRTYRTGDLAVAAADGCLTHVGRSDFQVKIRGIRVNPAEVETALSGLDGVAQAAVVACAGSDGAQDLAAFVVGNGAAQAPAVLRGQLSARLPAHLLPARIELVAALPRTASGKVDRRALAATTPRVRAAPGLGGGPRDPIEVDVCRIWEEVLGIAGLGIDDDFLDLGGDSLRALRVVARVAARFTVELGAGDLLVAGTPATMAGVIAVALRRAGHDHAD